MAPAAAPAATLTSVVMGSVVMDKLKASKSAATNSGFNATPDPLAVAAAISGDKPDDTKPAATLPADIAKYMPPRSVMLPNPYTSVAPPIIAEPGAALVVQSDESEEAVEHVEAVPALFSDLEFYFPQYNMESEVEIRKIFVEILTGDTLAFDVPVFTTIDKIKARIIDDLELDVSQPFTLFLDDEPLDGGLTIFDIQNESTLRMDSLQPSCTRETPDSSEGVRRRPFSPKSKQGPRPKTNQPGCLRISEPGGIAPEPMGLGRMSSGPSGEMERGGVSPVPREPSLDSDERQFREEKRQFNKSQKKDKQAVYLETAKDEATKQHDAQKLDAAVRDSQLKDKNWLKLATALNIDPESLKKDATAKRFGGIVNMAFLTVLIGCELDLYGFVMALPGYWGMEILVVRGLLVAMPSGYFIAVLMYLYYAGEVRERIKKADGSANIRSTVQRRNPVFDGASGEEVQEPVANLDDAYSKRPRAPLDLRYYHFLPILRYYLVIKEKEADDIEAIFRVNSLSSFTMGVAQIVAIIFVTIVNQEKMTIFVKINIASQIINWLITFIYFLTPISEKMAGQLKVETLNKNTADDLRTMCADYLGIMNQTAQAMRPESDMTEFADKIDNEIWAISKTSKVMMPLQEFDMRLKLQALGHLRRKNNLEYAKLGI